MATKKAVKKQALSITPLGDRVVLKPVEEANTQTPSGIIIPDSANEERPAQGVVLKVGPGKVGDDNELLPMTVKEGDRVIFAKFGPEEVTVDDQEYLIVSESKILGIVE